MPALSKRLSVIASIVPQGARVCDIGTDHAYLAIELMKSGRAKSVIAADIGQKPLLCARKNVAASGVEGIELRLCDGLSGIEAREVDTVVIAGMGGEVISGILDRGRHISRNKNVRFILQPTTSPEHLRNFLLQNGYHISDETAVYENGKLYSVMLIFFTGEICSFPEYYPFIGKVTPETEAGLLYIKKQQNRCLKCMNALKPIDSQQKEFLHYKNICNGITDYLNSFTEKNNGI